MISIQEMESIGYFLPNGKHRCPAEVILNKQGSSINFNVTINLKHIAPVEKSQKDEKIPVTEIKS